jgi:murein DD-endopeptidase MepM/ murein hydrolase activator NlpD
VNLRDPWGLQGDLATGDPEKGCRDPRGPANYCPVPVIDWIVAVVSPTFSMSWGEFYSMLSIQDYIHWERMWNQVYRPRGCDRKGCGHFGAPRGDHLHQGADYAVEPGQPIVAPLAGEVTEVGYPYGDDLSYRYIEIANGAYVVRVFYVAPASSVIVRVRVRFGEIIGLQQPLGRRYPGITEHVHIKVRYRGRIVDPMSFRY